MTAPATMTETDRRELEREVREALFRRGAEKALSPSANRPYKGRLLQGSWATAGQTGASVLNRTGEPSQGGNLAPVRFSISSPGGSSSSRGSPQRSGSGTPNTRTEQTPPRQPRESNWSTPSPSGRYRRGNRGSYRHSRSGPERGYETENHQEKASPRRCHSDQNSETDQSDLQKESHDSAHQSDINNWNIHMPRSRRGNSKGRGRGGGQQRDGPTQRERGRGRGGRGRGGEGRGRDQYQRSQSDVTGQTRTRGRHRNPPYTEPTIREQSQN